LPPIIRPGTGQYVPQPSDPLGEIGREVRELRRAPRYDDSRPPEPGDSPVWPYGLGFDLLLGAGAVWVTIRRLRTPVRALPRGVRVA
jgi:ABC-2 type transport system permease protein